MNVVAAGFVKSYLLFYHERSLRWVGFGVRLLTSIETKKVVLVTNLLMVVPWSQLAENTTTVTLYSPLFTH